MSQDEPIRLIYFIFTLEKQATMHTPNEIKIANPIGI
jgi:hypothetical protein